MSRILTFHDRLPENQSFGLLWFVPTNWEQSTWQVKSAFHTLPLSCKSTPAQSSSVLRLVRLIFMTCGMRISFNHLMQFSLPKGVCTWLNSNLSCILCSSFLLPAFHRFLWPNRHFTLKWIPVLVKVLLVQIINHKHQHATVHSNLNMHSSECTAGGISCKSISTQCRIFCLPVCYPKI